MVMNNVKIIDVLPENAERESFFCVKNFKDPGFTCKKLWFDKYYPLGLRLKIVKNDLGKALGFIEYIPVRYAWRPVEAENFMFIHCMFIYPNSEKGRGNASLLIKECEKDALEKKMDGVCVMTSDGPWITDKRVFLKNGYVETGRLGRFELMTKKFNPDAPDPSLIDWTMKAKDYRGWHILYADQCPWHEKSIIALNKVAAEKGIDLQVKKLVSPEKAKKGPSGFGVFSLLKDGKLLEDHYISESRFRNILKKELGTNPM